MEGGKRSYLLSLCGQLLWQVLTPCHIQEEEMNSWIRISALSYAAEMDGHVLGTLCAVTMALLTNRLDLCIQGLFGAGKSKSMAILILALIQLDVDRKLKILFLCKENSGTRSFADLLQWLDPPEGVLRRLGRLVGDQERNKSSYSHTRFDINPRERRQMLNKCQLVMATGGTVAQDLTMHVVHVDGLYAGSFSDDHWRRSTVRHRPWDCHNQPAQTATTYPLDRRCTTDPWRTCASCPQRQAVTTTLARQETWPP